MGRVRVTSRVVQWSEAEKRRFDIGLLQAMTDVHRLSQVYSPKDTRALVKSARVEREGELHYKVSYNTPYARRRHFENEKNPQTLNYLERAGDETFKNIKKYIT